MVLFTARALATVFRVGPKFFQIGTDVKIAGRIVTLIPPVAIARQAIQIFAIKAGINTAIELTNTDAFIANKIIGKTIRPLTAGRVTTTVGAGEAVFSSIASLEPGGAPARPADLIRVGLPALVLPFVAEEVFEETLIAAGVPRFVITFFRVSSVIGASLP